MSTDSAEDGVEEASGGPRARYREQVRAEIRARAWDQIAVAGASGLSLKAIAKQMGMTAPGLYRYFASRDDLLTELILGAYEDLAETAEAATAAPDTSAEEQLQRLAEVLRQWALSDPQRYLLIYGTPVPGYSGPPEATVLATRIFSPVLTAFTDLERAAGRKRSPTRRRGPAQASHNSHAFSAQAFSRAVTFWTRLHGVLSLELAGHFVGMGIDAEQHYDQESRSMTSPEP